MGVPGRLVPFSYFSDSLVPAGVFIQPLFWLLEPGDVRAGGKESSGFGLSTG